MFGNTNQPQGTIPNNMSNSQGIQPNVTRAQIIYPISQQGEFFFLKLWKTYRIFNISFN